MAYEQPSRRQALRALAGGASVAVGAPAGRAALPKKRPNVLFLFTDDQRFDTICALNNPAIETPNMDRLVRRGTACTHAHIMGGMQGAICMPSRAMLLTGRTLFHLDRDGREIPKAHTLLPECFGQAGYETFGTGKWHNGPGSYARSFESGASIFFGGMSDHLAVPVHDFDRKRRYRKKDRYMARAFSSELFSDAAVRFLHERDRDRPFFAHVSYTAPHDPRMANPAMVCAT